jgi:ribosomal protein S2
MRMVSTELGGVLTMKDIHSLMFKALTSTLLELLPQNLSEIEANRLRVPVVRVCQTSKNSNVVELLCSLTGIAQGS